MSDRKKIGVRVDESLWQEFVNFVESEKGQKRGVLGDELENAIRNYIHFGTDQTLPEVLTEVNERLYRVEDAVGTTPADGGVDTIPEPIHTRAPEQQAPDEKPPANAATDKKVLWLAEQVRDKNGEDFNEVHPKVLKDVVKDAYGFRRDTAKRYVERLREHFDLSEHPNNNYPTLVTPGYKESILEQRRQEAEQEVDEKL